MRYISAVIVVIFLFCPVSVFAETKEISAEDMAKEWFEKGLKYSVDKDYEKAIEAFTKAIALKPDYAYAYTNRGLVYYSKGQYDRAIEDYNKAIVLDPNDAEAYNNRGVTYAVKNDMERAISDYKKACDMGNELGCKNLQEVSQNK